MRIDRFVLAMVSALPLLLAPAAGAQTPGFDPGAAVLGEDPACSFLATPLDDPRPALGSIRCGTLEVPENWRLPEGRRIQLSWVVLASEAAAPPADPVVYLEGGPGGSSLRQVQFLAETFAPLRAERDVVLFDQRGAGLSSPLRCAAWTLDDLFALDAESFLTGQPPAAPVAADGEPATPPAPSDPDPTLPEVTLTEDDGARTAQVALPLVESTEATAERLLNEARLVTADATAACAQQLAAAGVDLRQYNSIANANDTVALLAALGYDTFNLYGISYGTRLALVLMRDHPDAGIRAVVLDSTFPPEIRGFERYPAEAHEVVLNLLADCAADAACNAAYPGLLPRLQDLLARLAAEPIADPSGLAVDDLALLDVLGGLTGNIAAVPYVPRLIAELERGETATYLAIATGAVGGSGQLAPAATPAPTAVATPAPEAMTDALVQAIGALLPGFAGDAAALTPAQLFLSALQVQVASLPRDEAANLVVRLSLLGNIAPSRENLTAFVERSFADDGAGIDRAVLLALIDGLSDADVAAVFDLVQATTDLVDPTRLGSNNLMFLSFECNEETPFERFEESVRTAQNLAVPQLGLASLPGMSSIFATCEVWPSGRAPAIEDRQVVSAVPTLVMAGDYDFQTPLTWNKSAFVGLPNAVFARFPMSGHGTILYSTCAADVATAFIADPTVTPDVRCADALRPDWALPDDPLPAIDPELLAPADQPPGSPPADEGG